MRWSQAGISVTTIRIGDDTVNLTLLNDISSRTGGQFYHVENVETLPELLLKDTSQAVAQAPRREESYVPAAGGRQPGPARHQAQRPAGA